MNTGSPVASALSPRPVTKEGAADVVNNELVPVVREIRAAVNRTIGRRLALTADFSLVGNEALVEVDATAGAVTVTLADPSDTHREVKIVKVDVSVNAVTVSGTVEGAASVSLTAQYDSVLLWPGETEFYT